MRASSLPLTGSDVMVYRGSCYEMLNKVAVVR